MAAVLDRVTPRRTSVGFISDAQDGAVAAEKLRVAGCDLIVGFLATYMTASMLVPVAQRSGAPVLLINLQPTEKMDHATVDTGLGSPTAGPARCRRWPTRSTVPGWSSGRCRAIWRTSARGRGSPAG